MRCQQAKRDARTASSTGDEDDPGRTAGVSSPRSPNATSARDSGLSGGRDRERRAVSSKQIEFAHRRGQQAFEGARDAFALHGDGGDQEHDDERQDAEHGDADAVEQRDLAGRLGSPGR